MERGRVAADRSYQITLVVAVERSCVHPVAKDHINELVRIVVTAEQHLRVVDLHLFQHHRTRPKVHLCELDG